VILASIVSIAGVLVGAWWAPFVAGLAIGFVQPRARFAVPVGAIVGLLSWALPLAALQVRYGAGSAAESLATIMGFGHQGAIPVVLTCVVGLLLGLTGAWLGSAARSLAYPAISR
jgi:predicted membrane protein